MLQGNLHGNLSKLPQKMTINTLVHQLFREEEVGFVDLWRCFFGRADMFMRGGLYLSGKGAAVFVDELSGAVDSGMGNMKIFLVANIVSTQTLFHLEAQGGI